MAHDQFLSYLSSNCRLSSEQNGNKKWHSTETSIIQTTDDIFSGFDKKCLTSVVFLDMRKAFDSINHGVLFAKLQDIGASSKVIEWCCSYLSSRYQVIRINTTLFDRLPVSCRVHQSSILGPLPFNIYMNDLPSTLRNCSAQS